MPSLNGLTHDVRQGNGKFLLGPLSQLGLVRKGTFFVIAAGRCNHAGKGLWRGVDTGNTSFIGIAAENSDTPADLWPEVQLDAYARGAAAILKHVRLDAQMCCGHREWAMPRGRKSDPLSIDMDGFREGVAIMAGRRCAPAHPRHGRAPSAHPAPRCARRGGEGDPACRARG
jgi:hypothetical protein